MPHASVPPRDEAASTHPGDVPFADGAGDGREWLVEAHGCDPAALASLPALQALFARMTDDLPLHPVAPAQWHVFPGPGGITGLALLAESHLAVHTFPEHGSLCLNLFCCKPRPEWEFEAQLRERFGAEEVRVRRLARPYAAPVTVP